MIWCSPDKAKAWDEFFASGKLPDNEGDCDNPVVATNALGAKLARHRDADARLRRRLGGAGRAAARSSSKPR